MWYVTTYDLNHPNSSSTLPHPKEKVWTICTDASQEGWETDGGYQGYGLPKDIAEFLAVAANEKEARDGVIIRNWNDDPYWSPCE